MVILLLSGIRVFNPCFIRGYGLFCLSTPLSHHLFTPLSSLLPFPQADSRLFMHAVLIRKRRRSCTASSLDREKGEESLEGKNTHRSLPAENVFFNQMIKHQRAQWGRRQCGQRGAVLAHLQEPISHSSSKGTPSPVDHPHSSCTTP